MPNVSQPGKNYYQKLLTTVVRLRIAFVLVCFSLTIGTVGFKWIEHSTWFDAFYMSIITLSTIGYTEIVPLSFTGRVFNSGLIIANLGLFAYSISTITSIFADGGFKAYFMEFKINEKISHLRGHTIVCGYGRHGVMVCEELMKQHIPFVVIESHEEKLEQFKALPGMLYIEGDATHDEILLEAGIKEASALIVTLPADANNLFIVLSARQINPTIRIISRANNEADEVKIKRAGADHVVIPERIGGYYMATLVNHSEITERFPTSDFTKWSTNRFS